MAAERTNIKCLLLYSLLAQKYFKGSVSQGTVRCTWRRKMQGKTKKNTKKSSLNKSCFPNNTKLHQPHLFCYFIESGRSLSTVLKTKTIVALNTGQSLWGLFPLKSLLITLQCMWVIIQGTLLTGFATVMNSNLKSSRNPSAAFLLDCSLCLPPQYVSCLYVNSSSSWGKKWVCAGFHKRRLRDSSH